MKILPHGSFINISAPFISPGSDIPILLTAFTGTAAFEIGGMTLHSALGFNMSSGKNYVPLQGKKLNTFRTYLSKLLLLVIDEISMVGADFFYHVHRRLEEITGNTQTPFGGISILAVGDFYQLPPVAQQFIFKEPSDPYAKLYGSLWTQHFKLVELTESMRQKDDEVFGQLLMRVRTGNCTQEDMSKLDSRIVSEHDPSYPLDALHVFTTNKEVDAHNLCHLSKFQNIFEFKSIDKRKDVNTGQMNVIFSKKSSETGGLRDTIMICVGARIMLTKNIDVSDGLVNGVLGTVVAFDGSDKNSIKSILVAFDSDRVGKMAIQKSTFKYMYPNAVPINRLECCFSVGKKVH